MKARIRIYNRNRKRILDTTRNFENDQYAISWGLEQVPDLQDQEKRPKRIRIDREPVHYDQRPDRIDGKSEKIFDQEVQDPEEE